VRENYFIKSIEQLLTNEEQNRLNNLLVQFPQYANEMTLFQKTILPFEDELFFENKAMLKKYYSAEEESAIAYTEGLMSNKERNAFVASLKNNLQLAKTVTLIANTKLVADATIVYENKNELKRKEAVLIPFYYRITAIAAALAVLVGLVYFYNLGDSTNKLASINLETAKTTEAIHHSSAAKNNNLTAQASSKKVLGNTKTFANKSNKITSPFANEKALVDATSKLLVDTNTITAITKLENSTTTEILTTESTLPTNVTSDNLFAEKNNSNTSTSTPEFVAENQTLTLKELATVKLKEKVLDEKAIKEQKKSGRLNKFTGIDFAQLAAKGLSKLVGRDIEVQAKYNQNGDVTQYGLAAGNLAFSRGR
jgi:hypothetical protein